jgi:uncharacterized protein (TIGR03382 family)
MCNRTKSNWFPAALAITSVCVVSPTVFAATSAGDNPVVSYSSAWSPPSPTVTPVIAHGNNGAPPPPIDIADVRDPGLVPTGSLIDELLKPDLHMRKGSLSSPGALRALPESLPTTGLDGPRFFDPYVGGGPIGQSGGAIPSPGTLALLALSTLALARRRRRT